MIHADGRTSQATETTESNMTSVYYQTITELEKNSISRDYILGWASGFLGNPKIEEQRLTEPYEAGYNDGQEQCTDNADNWK